MKVEHDLLCNECLSPAGTVAAAAAPQPSPGQLIGLGAAAWIFIVSGWVGMCNSVIVSAIHRSLPTIYTSIIFTTSNSPSKTILKPYAMKLCCSFYVTALKCVVKCHKKIVFAVFVRVYYTQCARASIDWQEQPQKPQTFSSSSSGIRTTLWRSPR